MSAPVVGLATVTERLDGVANATVRQVYLDALSSAGCVPVLLAGTPDGALPALQRLDGLVLGGHQSMVEPARYGGPESDELLDPGRDALALALIAQARRLALPTLGICRGLQELNVSYGGSLRDLCSTGQDQLHREPAVPERDAQYLPSHPIRLREGGLLSQLVGAQRTEVNSLHTQAIDRLAAGLTIEAQAPDGVIEAVVDERLPFVLAV
ncbi:MAG: gamma-glutamyl-gamma-aminobutyrate hydrolase family protein, partial [Jatrophihabitantaceae bacterium]